MHDVTKELNWRAIFLLAVCPIGLLTVELLSEYAGRVFGADEAEMGLLAGAQAGTAALASLICYLVPRFHHKQLVPIATFIFFCANALCLFVESLSQLIILNAIAGTSAGAICSKAYQILTAEKHPSRQLGAMIALQAATLSISFILIPYLLEWHGKALFIVILFWSTLCLFCAFKLKSTANTFDTKVMVSSSKRRWFFLSIIACYACHGGYSTFIAQFASEHGISLITTGWVLTAGCAIGLFTGIWSAMESEKDDSSAFIMRPIRISFACLFIATLMLLASNFSVSLYLASVIIYNFGWCFAVPYLIQAAANLNDGGRASSLMLLLQALGMGVGAVVVGQLAVQIGIPVALNIVVVLLGGLSVVAIGKVVTESRTFAEEV